MTSKFALVIANTEYQDANFAKLSAPGKDAEEFAQILLDPDIAAFDDVQVLINEEESKISRSIARFFVNRKRDDLLLLYFSGHGIRNEQGQLFLAVNDTEISILEATGIPAAFITFAMNNSRSQRQLLILDCCNSGAFAQGSKSVSAVGKSMGIANAFEGSGFGRVVLTATDATQYAWEGDRVIGNTQKSLFTHFLIEGLRGEADRNSDGHIDVDELFEYAYEQVVRKTPKQTPGKWSYKQQGDIIVRENIKISEVKPLPLPFELIEMLSHSNSGVRKVAMQELITLAGGKHQGLARAAQDKLNELVETDDSLTIRKIAREELVARGLIPAKKAASAPLEEDKKEELTTREPSIIQTPQRAAKKPKITLPWPGISTDWKRISSKLPLRLIGGIGCGLLIISFSIWSASILFNNLPAIFPRSTQTSQPTSTLTSLPAKTSTPSPTPTSVSPTPRPGLGSTMISDKDSMELVYVPASEFTMGMDAEDSLVQCENNGVSCVLNWFNNEQPSHTIALQAFWIDKTEVTNAMYDGCVQAGNCNPPSSNDSSTHTPYFGNPEFGDYPVILVSWVDAKNYCEWVDRRLPTEAEWEKAASWDHETETKFFFPWGDSIDCSFTNFTDEGNACEGDTTFVGIYPKGVSPYGALDMAGNVWEWVSSLYDQYPYSATDGREDLTVSGNRVLRGGAWSNTFGSLRSVNRVGFDPIRTQNDVGFRCAMDATP